MIDQSLFIEVLLLEIPLLFFLNKCSVISIPTKTRGFKVKKDVYRYEG